jgi:hypothetical protein
MRKKLVIPALLGIFALTAAQAFAQSATAVMRNGDRVRVDVLDMGANFTFRINGSEQQVPINDVVLLDFAGDGRNIPGDELNRANSASGNGLVVLRNGDTINTRLLDITGIPSRGVFSGDRQINLSDISRIYLGSPGNTPGFNAGSSSNSGEGRALEENTRTSTTAPNRARTVVVPGNVQWTNTNMNVSRGQAIRFEPSGEVRLSHDGNDVARPAGALSGRSAAAAPIPSIPAGALIGRVGNGQPFSIGDPNQVIKMPANGRLYLMVNDDHVDDNSGNYVVRVWEP